MKDSGVYMVLLLFLIWFFSSGFSAFNVDAFFSYPVVTNGVGYVSFSYVPMSEQTSLLVSYGNGNVTEYPYSSYIKVYLGIAGPELGYSVRVEIDDPNCPNFSYCSLQVGLKGVDGTVTWLDSMYYKQVLDPTQFVVMHNNPNSRPLTGSEYAYYLSNLYCGLPYEPFAHHLDFVWPFYIDGGTWSVVGGGYPLLFFLLGSGLGSGVYDYMIDSAVLSSLADHGVLRLYVTDESNVPSMVPVVTTSRGWAWKVRVVQCFQGCSSEKYCLWDPVPFVERVGGYSRSARQTGINMKKRGVRFGGGGGYEKKVSGN